MLQIKITMIFQFISQSFGSVETLPRVCIAIVFAFIKTSMSHSNSVELPNSKGNIYEIVETKQRNVFLVEMEEDMQGNTNVTTTPTITAIT